jgi:3'5'-cyclic nucleotide phosphodiesterase
VVVWDLASLEERQRVCEVLLHAADISAQTQPWERASRWSARVVAEFHLQSLREEALGAEPTVFMKGLASRKQQGKLQADFCAYVLAPLWGALADLYDPLKSALADLETNSKRHRAIADEDEDAGAGAGATATNNNSSAGSAASSTQTPTPTPTTTTTPTPMPAAARPHK